MIEGFVMIIHIGCSMYACIYKKQLAYSTLERWTEVVTELRPLTGIQQLPD